MNRTTLKALVLGMASLFMTVVVAAQAPAGEEPDLQSLVKELDLSDEQKEELAEIFSETKEERLAILEEHGIELAAGERPDRRAMRKAAPALRESRKKSDERIAAVLSESQFETFERLRKEGRKKALQRFKEKRKDS